MQLFRNTGNSIPGIFVENSIPGFSNLQIWQLQILKERNPESFLGWHRSLVLARRFCKNTVTHFCTAVWCTSIRWPYSAGLCLCGPAEEKTCGELSRPVWVWGWWWQGRKEAGRVKSKQVGTFRVGREWAGYGKEWSRRLCLDLTVISVSGCSCLCIHTPHLDVT